MPHSLDIIGDVHGELPALEALGRRLGYRVADGWTHSEDRFPVFLGDLVDRGAHSLAVAEMVQHLVEERRAFCIMGNHEYNLVAWYAGWMAPKPSNTATTREVKRSPQYWEPVLDFFRSRPLAVELPGVRAMKLPGLRIMHACWHKHSLEEVQPILRPALTRREQAADSFEWLEQHVALVSPFDAISPLRETRLHMGLRSKKRGEKVDPPHEILMKGYELPVDPPFRDMDSELREKIRAMWWRDDRSEVDPFPAQVFGHYGGFPPVTGSMVPTCPTGHPDLLAQAHRLVNHANEADAKRVLDGTAAMDGDLACIDFHGVTAVSEMACIGALRWPERQIVWASAKKTAETEERIEGFKLGLDWAARHT